MSESKKEAAAPAAAAGGNSAGGGKMVMILSIVNVLATFGIAAVLGVSFLKEKREASVADIDAASEAGGRDAEGGEHGEKAAGEHGGGASDKGGAKKSNPAYGRMVPLDQFTVNLSAPGSSTPKFVRVNISIEVPTEDAEAEVTQKMPQVRNVIIDLFNSKRPSDLATPDGRDYLKEEIRSAINGFMVSGKVKGVFFTNFALTT